MAEVATSLASAVASHAEGAPVLVDCFVSGVPPPVTPPDVMVTTPDKLLGVHDWFANQRNRERFVRTLKAVVLDEADVLLGGAFHKDMMRLLEWLRIDDKWKAQDERGDGEEVGPLAWRGPRWYICAGATIPDGGKGSVAEYLRKRFPDAAWARGPNLHETTARVDHRWIFVDDDEAAAETLKEVLIADGAFAPGRKTMVFAKSVKAMDHVMESVTEASTSAGGVDESNLYLYSSKENAEVRHAMLKDFGTNGGVLVCTDAAARGLDVNGGVDHVVQADFAADAVSFLHRIGRTARAGASGSATSIVRPAEHALAKALRFAAETGVPIEDAFSRKRSFSKKIRRRGEDHIMQRVKDRAAADAEAEEKG